MLRESLPPAVSPTPAVSPHPPVAADPPVRAPANPSLRFLKVTIKSLSAEARIIRLEETRSRGELRAALSGHRRGEVRREVRSAFVAYGYLRGRPYQVVEPRVKSPPDWTRVERLVAKYGLGCAKDGLKGWREEAPL